MSLTGFSIWLFFQRSAITQQELDNLLVSINMEISLQRANLMLDNTENMLNRLPSPRCHFQYMGQPVKKSDSTPSRNLPSLQTLSPGSSMGHPVDIESEIERLEQQLDTLESRVHRTQDIYHHRLENLATEIPDSICIQQTLCR